MIERDVFSSFIDELEKEAGWESAVQGVGKMLKPGWGALERGANLLGRGGAAGTVARTGVGAGIGAAAAGEDNRASGAIMGGLAGGFAPTLLRDAGRAGKATVDFVANPAKAVRQGWQAHSPVGGLRAGQRPNAVSKRMRKDTLKEYKDAREAAGKPGMFARGDAASRQAKVDKKYKHLVDGGEVQTIGNWGQGAPTVGGRIQGVANELSRRGWTGKGTGMLGGATKYMPVGAKGLTAGFGAMSAPTIYQSATGEIPLSAGVGELASNAAYVAAPATKGLGMIGTIGMAEALRAGATAPVEAVENQVQQRWSPSYRQGFGRNAVAYG